MGPRPVFTDRARGGVTAHLRAGGRSLAVRYPNVFHLRGVLKKPPAFALLDAEPIDGAALIRKHLLQISNRERLNRRGVTLVSKTPNSVHVIVLGQHLHQ